MGTDWYCLFCTSSFQWSHDYIASHPQTPVTGSHYLIGASPRGPWRVAEGGFLDGAEPCIRYAARVVPTPEGLQILGFADGGKAQFGGYVMNPQFVDRGADGLLSVRPLSAE
jgi:beta-fructofuranosidase